MNLDILQWPGAALGLIGAALVSGNSNRARRWGFATWIVSNLVLIVWCVWSGAWGLLAMYSVYLITSGMGWRNNRNE
jgi:hypothetical protein